MEALGSSCAWSMCAYVLLIKYLHEKLVKGMVWTLVAHHDPRAYKGE